VETLTGQMRTRYPFLSEPWARRLVRAYGTEVTKVLGTARTEADLGRRFGATLTAREVDWLIAREYARSAADIVWRRSKLGLRMTAEEIAALDTYVAGKLSEVRI
jgi:glycerol-3-phosphate dehydrogenase